MKSITKNLFLILTGVCLLALVAFLIELIIINTGTEPEEPESVIAGESGGSDESNGEVDYGPFGPDGYSPPPPPERPPPEGTRYDITVDTAGTVLTIYAKDDLFNYTETDLGWNFNYRSGGSANLEITHVFISPQGIRTDAEAFLNSLIEDGGAEFKGAQRILDTDMDGYCVQARSGNITYEAWLYRLPGNDLALAFLINYEFNGQRDDLYTLLNSMSIGQPSSAEPANSEDSEGEEG